VSALVLDTGFFEYNEFSVCPAAKMRRPGWIYVLKIDDEGLRTTWRKSLRIK
jgi:hypothetical protein